jgi:hypothetical protein
MKKMVALAVLAAVFAIVLGAAAQSKQPIQESLNLVLTKAQLAKVKATRSGAVEVVLTKAQVEAMRKAFPKWKGTKVMLSAKNLSDKGLVLFFREVHEMDPQPSPYPLPTDLKARLMEANPQPSP